MLLEKSGITIEVTHPAEIRHYKSLGFQEPQKPSKAVAAPEKPMAEPEPEATPEVTPEEQNEAAVEEVNEPKSKSKWKAVKDG